MGRREFSLLLIAFLATLATAVDASTITGKVTDAQNGNPLNNITIAAYGVEGNAAAQTDTNSKGNYSLNLSNGTYRVLAYDRDGNYATMYYGDADSFESSGTVSGDASNVNFALRRAGFVIGSVAASINPAGITVAAYNLDGTRRGFTHTDSGGGYRLVLPPGNYKIAAYDDGGVLWPKFFSDEISFTDATVVNINASANVATAFRLDAAAHVVGSVADADTNIPLNAMTVAAYDLEGTLISQTLTNDVGAFDLKAPSGTFRILVYDLRQTYATAYWGGVSFATATNLALSAGETRSNVRVALRRGGVISGLVTDTSGSPLVVTVAAYAPDGSFRTSVQTGPTGSFNLLLAPGDYKLAAYDARLVYATQFYSLQKSFAAATTIPVMYGVPPGPLRVFTLERGARISGVVTDADTGAQVPGVTISAYDTKTTLIATATSSANGNYDMILPAGTYRFVAYDSALRYATAFAGGSTFETSLTYTETAPSNDRVDFRVSRGIHVSGNVMTPSGAAVSGVEVSALDGNGNHVASSVTKDGTFDLVLLPNEYRFVVVDPLARYGVTYAKSPVSVKWGAPVSPVLLTVTASQRRHSVGH